MGKSKHHYVPKFYLKKFASAPRRICVCKINDKSCYQDVSLKGQCYRAKLYGKTDDVENALMKLETVIAPTLSAIVESATLPDSASDDHAKLLLFFALQVSRTPIAAESMAGGFQKILNRIEERHPGREIVDADKLRMEPGDTLLQLLADSTLIAECFKDLGAHLVVNKSIHNFITSDNPTVQYNLYCEGIKHGNTGALKRGLQIFLPLSPKHLVILYDKKVYKVGSRDMMRTELSELEDIETLNLLQVANAEKVLLFSDWGEAETVKHLARKAIYVRR